MLNTHKFERTGRLAVLLETQFDHFVYALHKGVEIFGLSVTAGKGWNRGYIVAFFIPFDEHGELAALFHKRFYRWELRRGEQDERIARL